MIKMSEKEWQEYCLKLLEQYIEENKEIFERLKNR